MASTFSPTLRLELIGDGDQSGIWGQTTNTNLGTLLEQSITGVVDITMVNANYTLTSFNGVSDEARNVVLVLGGTNAAVRDVIAPLVEKLYVVRNNTSGGFAVNIRAATGSSVSVPSGATVWVYCDGTNFNAIGTESVGNFEVNGNLTVTGSTNAVAATYTGNVAALNLSTANLAATGTGSFTGNVSALNVSTANVAATGAGSFTGNVSAANFIGAGLTITSINASNISAGTIANARTTAASANGASTIVARDSNGSFAANVGTFVSISGAVSGNGAGLTDINASNISSGTISNARTTAASANGASTIVARDSNGSFTGNVITGTTGTFTSISGNGVALTAINASNISSGTIANARTTAASANGASTIVARDSNGSFAANVVTATTGTFNGDITAQNITASARIFGTSPNSGSSGAVSLRDATGNPNAVYLQALNNAGSSEYGYLKFNSNASITTSGAIIGNLTGTATNATTATNLSGGSVAATTLSSSGATVLNGSNIVRNITLGSDEIAWAQSGSTNAFLNISDANGSNGGSYSMVIRGLASAGATGVRLAEISLNADSVTINGYEISKGLGFGGTVWHNVTGIRAFNVGYTNSYSYPIVVSASTNFMGGSQQLLGYVNGVLIAFWKWQFNGAGAVGGCIFTVPPGASYSCNTDGGIAVQNWVELY